MVKYSEEELEEFAERGASPGAEKVLKALGEHTVEDGKLRKKTRAELAGEQRRAKASADTAELVEASGEVKPEYLEEATRIKREQMESTKRTAEARARVIEKQKYEIHRSSFTAQAQKQSPKLPAGQSTDLTATAAAQDVRSGKTQIIYEDIPFKGKTRPSYIREVNKPQTYTLSFGEGVRPTEDEGFFLEEHLKGSVKAAEPSTPFKRRTGKLKSTITHVLTRGRTNIPGELITHASLVSRKGQSRVADIDVKGITIGNRIQRNIDALTKDPATQTGVLFVGSRVASGLFKLGKRTVEKPVTTGIEIYAGTKILKLLGRVPVIGKFLPGATIVGGVGVHAGAVTLSRGPVAGASALIEDTTQLATIYGGFRAVRAAKIRGEVRRGTTYKGIDRSKALVLRQAALEGLKSKGVQVSYKVQSVEGFNVIGRVKGPLINRRIVAHYGPPREVGRLPDIDYIAIRGTFSGVTTPPSGKPGLSKISAVGVSKPVSIDMKLGTFQQFITKGFPQSISTNLLGGPKPTSKFKAGIGKLLRFSTIKAGKGDTLYEETGINFEPSGNAYGIGKFTALGVKIQPANARPPSPPTPSRGEAGLQPTAGQVKGKARILLPRHFLQRFTFSTGKAVRLVEYESTGKVKIIREAVAFKPVVEKPFQNIDLPGFKATRIKKNPFAKQPVTDPPAPPQGNQGGSGGGQVTLTVQKPVVVQAVKVKATTKQGVKAAAKTISKALAGERLKPGTFQEQKAGQEGQKAESIQIGKGQQAQRVAARSKAAQRNIIKSRSGAMLALRSKVVAGIKPAQKVIYKQAQQSQQSLNVKAAARQSSLSKALQVQDSAVGQLQRVTPAQRIVQARAVATSPKSRGGIPRTLPPPPSVLLPPKPSIGQEVIRQKKEAGFFALVRRRGQFRAANIQPLTREAAIGFGAFKVGTSAAASFKIVPAGRAAEKSIAPRGNLADFTKKSGIFIEKPSRRIKSIGELQEITFKGLAAQKSRGIFGGL